MEDIYQTLYLSDLFKIFKIFKTIFLSKDEITLLYYYIRVSKDVDNSFYSTDNPYTYQIFMPVVWARYL